MKKVLLVTAAMFALAIPAKADIVPQTPFLVDLGATGFGDAPRILGLQANGFEQGGTAAGASGTTTFFTNSSLPPGTACTTVAGCNNGQPLIQVDKSFVYSVGSLGWFSGANVGIGLDTDEAGNVTGVTVDSINLSLYSSAGALLHTFSLASGFDIGPALLAAQQGNGNSVFNFGLNAAEEQIYNNILVAQGCTIGVACNTVFEGLGASLGAIPGNCPVLGVAGCLGTTDGPDSFLAFKAVPGPIVGAGLPGLLGALGLLGFNRFRRRRQLVA